MDSPRWWRPLWIPVVICLFLFVKTGWSEPLQLGIDRFEEDCFRGLAGRRVGLLTNTAGVNSRGISTIDILRKAEGVQLVALFGPEHGVDGRAPAGKSVSSYTDSRTGLKVHSLFGATRKPTTEMMEEIDDIVVDLQDIGVRSYTYISTLGLLMEAAAEQNKRVIVLDRPNPLGGVRVEGPRLDPKFRTFVGLYDIPYIYGVTIGELALWINRRHLKKPCQLIVVPMKGWTRTMEWEETGLRWVPTSPNIPTPVAARGYAATGLLGEIGVSNGANEAYPFELIVSDGLDPNDFARFMQKGPFPDIRFEPFVLSVDKGKYSGTTFEGVRVKVPPHAEGNLAAIPFYAIPYLRQRFPKREYFANRTREPVLMFDKINGSDQPRRMILMGRSPTEIVGSWKSGVEQWKLERKPYLIYPE